MGLTGVQRAWRHRSCWVELGGMRFFFRYCRIRLDIFSFIYIYLYLHLYLYLILKHARNSSCVLSGQFSSVASNPVPRTSSFLSPIMWRESPSKFRRASRAWCLVWIGASGGALFSVGSNLAVSPAAPSKSSKTMAWLLSWSLEREHRIAGTRWDRKQRYRASTRKTY